MLKRIKLKNSTVLLIGIILIFLGIFVYSLDFFKSKKDKTFSDMNLLLLESEMPINIKSEEEIIEKQEEEDKKVEEQEEPKEPQKEEKHEYSYNYIGILEIPKLNLKRGFLDINSRYNNVDYNVTVIIGSTLPDVPNHNLILAAHSGPCSYCYFDKLYKLSKGDEAYITYKNVKHFYKIVDIYEVKKDGTVAIYRDYNKNVLTLITCTRNTDNKQTVYILEEYKTV